MAALRICLVSSEVAPFAKTGGLADVTAALARYLAAEGHDVRLFLPLYRRVREGNWERRPVPELSGNRIAFAARDYTVRFETTPLPGSGLDVFLVDCPELFDRDQLYTWDEDEPLRFATFSRAVLEACQWMRWSPDVVHCNDWHTGLVPLLLKSGYAWDRLFDGTRSLLTIHNIAFQGVFSSSALSALGWEDQTHMLWREDTQRRQVNFLRTGLLYADAVSTVSETYAREIQSPEVGMGLDELLRARSDTLFGIVNGVDYGEWNPETDPHLPHRYSARDLAGKARNRSALLEELGLAPDPTGPVLGIVSRLTWQKGFELLPDVLSAVLGREDVRLTVLGSGEEQYERYFHRLGQAFPGKAAFRAGYDEALAHRIEAGSDVFLMPSRYEPCGLNQMYSLRYGTPPVVRRTGGLADTVRAFDPGTGEGTGFLFDEFRPDALLAALSRALAVFPHRDSWRRLMRNGMGQDFSWRRQGKHYVELYRRLCAAPAAAKLEP